MTRDTTPPEDEAGADLGQLIEKLGRPIHRLVYEHGVELHLSEDGDWCLPQGEQARSVVVDLKDLADMGIRPVFLVQRTSATGSHPLLLTPNGSIARFPRAMELASRRGFLYDAHGIAYLGNAIEYHTRRLAESYSSICRQYVDGCSIPGHPDLGRALYGGQSEPYHEFDALLGAIRRAYDTLRYPLSKLYPTDGRLGDSLVEYLKLCSDVPGGLRRELQGSWEAHGERMKVYRDCIHHYVPLDFGQSSVHMTEILSAVWTVSALIPDNPEARSSRKFTFAGNLDALEYGWPIAIEVLRIMAVVVQHVLACDHGA
jgi:hypothetical protein